MMKPPKMPNFALVDKVMVYLNGLNPREKTMMVALAALVVLALDYLLIVNPMVGVFVKITPKIGIERSALSQLKDDKKKESQTEKEWAVLKESLQASEDRFVAPNAIPKLLENLSKLASDSGVRIVSLKPVESGRSDTPGFSRVPIRISALAGTHELGRFLAKLEGGPTFFRVTNLKVSDNEAEPRRHPVDLEIETYRKVG